jgi:hypothetical protein
VRQRSQALRDESARESQAEKETFAEGAGPLVKKRPSASCCGVVSRIAFCWSRRRG